MNLKEVAAMLPKLLGTTLRIETPDPRTGKPGGGEGVVIGIEVQVDYGYSFYVYQNTTVELVGGDDQEPGE